MFLSLMIPPHCHGTNQLRRFIEMIGMGDFSHILPPAANNVWMSEMNDLALIQEYADHGSETAFAGLVHRHINLVYSVALRFTGNPQDAQDVTQAVFVILAQKAANLRQRTTLTGWLYETTRFTARQLLRTRARRQAREQEHYMESTLDDSNTDSVWQQLAPLLEEAMTQLSGNERTLVALRFFERKSAGETATLLGIQETAARKRMERAVEKLRKFFVRRGVALTATAIAGAVSANSVHAAPVTLANTISVVGIAKGAAASASTSTLVKGTLKFMAWAKVKTALVATTALILAAGTTTVIVKSSSHHPQVKLQWTPAEKESFQQESISRMSEGRQWARAAIKFADDHGNILPTNFRQMKTYVSNLSASNWEIVSGGSLSGIAKPAQTILFKEKEARPSPDGKFAKAYVFVDGHVEMVSSPNYEFTAVEQQEGFLIRPAKN